VPGLLTPACSETGHSRPLASGTPSPADPAPRFISLTYRAFDQVGYAARRSIRPSICRYRRCVK